MVVSELIKLLQEMQPSAELDVSVDVSTDDETQCRRVFVNEWFGWQSEDGDPKMSKHNTLLLGGATNWENK